MKYPKVIIPEKNIYWREIGSTDRIVLHKKTYIVETSDARQAVAYWAGSEAAEAQRWLNEHSKPAPDWDSLLSSYDVYMDGEILERKAGDIEVIVAATAVPYVRGRLSGPPELCYPDEGGFVEDITSFDSFTGELVEMTDEEESTFQESLYIHWQNECEDDYDPPDNWD